MNSECCYYCKYYFLHYARDRHGHYLSANCGHCFFPRLKSRLPGDVCDKFVKKDGD